MGRELTRAMRNAFLTMLALAAWTAPAAAQEAPPVTVAEHRGFLGGGILLASDQFVDAGFAAEGSVAIPKTPLSVFVLGSLGSASDIGGRGEFARQQVERRGPLFAAALGPFLRANPGDELSQHQRDDEIHPEHHRVFQIRDEEGEAWRKEKEIPHQRAQGCGHDHRPASDEQGQAHHREQEVQGDGAMAEH